jgi:hypothetical protein
MSMQNLILLRPARLLAGAAAMVVSLAFPIIASAADIYGFGAQYCSTFNENILSTPSIESDYFTWVQGFISGANAIILSKHGQSKQVDASTKGSQKKQIRDFCRNHPRSQYVEAAVELWTTLPSQ